MKLNELIERLQAMQSELQSSTGEDDIGERTEVRIASQPSWPLAHDVETVMAEEESMAKGRKGPVLWLGCSATVEYGEHPYAPRYAWDDDRLLTSDETEEMDS